MREVPLDVYLSFPLPNYTHPQTRGPALIIINAVLLFFVTVVVALRVYTRTVIKRSMGWDDYSIIIGFLFTAGLVASVILANEKFYWYALLCSGLLALHTHDSYRERHIYDVPIPSIPGKLLLLSR